MEVILQIITGVVVTFLSAVVLRMQDEAKKVQQQREAENESQRPVIAGQVLIRLRF